MILVYHASSQIMRHYKFVDGVRTEKDLLNIFNGNSTDEYYYKHVSTVDTDNLDKCFELTNHVYGNWILNKEIKEISSDRLRSTSIGDILVAKDGIYLVEGFGFSKLFDFD